VSAALSLQHLLLQLLLLLLPASTYMKTGAASSVAPGLLSAAVQAGVGRVLVSTWYMSHCSADVLLQSLLLG
jgi:CHAT domain-containing protein